MDFCNKKTIDSIWRNSKEDESQVNDVRTLFLRWTIVSLSGCVINLIFCLFCWRRCLKKTKKTMKKSREPTTDRDIDQISLLHLLMTNYFACFVCGLGIVFTKLLPLHLNLSVGDCFLLILEIGQISSLMASGLHHLSHEFSLLNQMTHLEAQSHLPLEARTTFPVSSSPKLLITSILTWICPSVAFCGYFWSIPCQGFRSSDCDFSFFLSFRHRVFVLCPVVTVITSVLILTLSFCQRSQRVRACFATALDVFDNKDGKVTRSFDGNQYNNMSFSYLEAAEIERLRRKLDRTNLLSFLFFLTFLISWSPRLIWLAVSCVDGCPFPLFDQSLLFRSMIGTWTENTIIFKVTADSLIFVLSR